MRIQIPTPCHEDWSAMTATEHGRYCQSCRKEVVDYSRMTDAELVARLRQASGSVCGRVRADQMDRALLVESSWNLGQAVRRRMAGLYGFAALLGGMLLQSRIAVAQRVAPTVVVPAQRYEESDGPRLHFLTLL